MITSDTKLIGFWPVLSFLVLSPVIAVVYAAYSLLYWLEARSKPLAYTWLLVFAPMNVLHNWIVCTLLFWEFPREGFTTKRLKRLKNSKDPWRRELADMLGGFLNSQDPNHY